MYRLSSYLRNAVAAFFLIGTLSAPVFAQDDELEALFAGLKAAEPAAAEQIAGRIYAIWAQSGSDSMDLLLSRGRDALEGGDMKRAVEHLSALIDHAPAFAEAYNARAPAYFQMGRYGQSLADIRQTLLLNPRHFNAMSGLALILEEIGEPEGALQAWREVERLHPNREGLSDAVQRLARQVEGAEL